MGITRRRRPTSRLQMLESVPVLNPAVRWERLESGQVMAVYRQDARGVRRLLMKLLATPETAQVLLDDAGTSVVGAIDAKRTVKDLIAYVSVEFKLSRKESEVSVLEYMEMLGKRRLIGFQVPPGSGEE